MTDKIYIQIGDVKQEAKGQDLEYILQTQIDLENQIRLENQQVIDKEELKQSAIAKLAKLGLTEDEAKAIVGIQ